LVEEDGGKIPDEVMSYIRKMAVHAVRERGESPETVAAIFNFNCHCIYRWLKQCGKGGYNNFETRHLHVRHPSLLPKWIIWLNDIVLKKSHWIMLLTRIYGAALF
jgi:hypothetical protein